LQLKTLVQAVLAGALMAPGLSVAGCGSSSSGDGSASPSPAAQGVTER
jgi:hypothetical protein